MAPRLPPWLAALAAHSADPTRGVQLRTPTISRGRPSNVTLDQILSTRRRGGGGGRWRSTDYPDSPEGVIQRLREGGQLSAAQIERVTEGERGDEFSPLSPGDWLDKLGDVGAGALEALATPGAYALSGLVEAADALANIPGLGEQFKPPEGSDFKERGVSWRDFVENAEALRKGEITGGDIVGAFPDQEVFGAPTDNKAVQTIAGLGLEIAADPLNYIGVGLADEPGKVARLLTNDDAIRTIARSKNITREAAQSLAERAAIGIKQKGITSLKDPDLLSAIGRRAEGGLTLRTPGTGPLGRLTRLDRALEKVSGGQLPRRISIAPAGTRIGDIAQGAAQGARKYSGLNLGLRKSATLAAKGLSGAKGPLRAAIRSADLEDPKSVRKAVEALKTLTEEPIARSVSKLFETSQTRHAMDVLKGATGDTSDLAHAVRGNLTAGLRHKPETIESVRTFFKEARQAANRTVGREIIADAGPTYVARVLTDDTKKKFGILRQGSRNVESIAQGRTYKAGDILRLGKDEETLLVEPKADSLGRSVEEQIEDFLVEHGKEGWFETDLTKIMPEYVKRLSRQVNRELLAKRLTDVGVGQPLRRAGTARPIERIQPEGVDEAAVEAFVQQRRLAGKRRNETSRRLYELSLPDLPAGKVKKRKQLINDLSRIWDELDEAVAKPIPWEQFHRKARRLPPTEWEIPFRKVLMDGFTEFGANTQLPVDVADALQAIGRIESTNWPRIWALHDRVLNTWKKAALLTPGYHWRNSFGGVYMNWLGDVDEGRYKQLAQLALHDRRGTLATAKIDDQLRSGYLEGKRLGIFSGGQSIKEIQETGPRVPFSLFRGSRRVAGGVENELRGVMFIDEYVKNGGDSTEAFTKMMKYHFDYEDLSPQEQKLRRLIPFYTWTRRSIPLMMEMVVRNPGKINRYFQVQRNVERLSPEDRFTPGYFERQFAIRLPWHSGGGQFYAMPDLPLMSLVDASESSSLLGQVSPFVKTPVELWSGKQFWKDLPITDKAVPIPTYLKWLTPALDAMQMTERGPGGEKVMTERGAYLMSQFVPQIGQARRLWPHPEDKRYKDRQFSSALSFLLGIGLRTNTEHEQANEVWRRYYSYEDEVQRNEALGFEPEAARALTFNAA